MPRHTVHIPTATFDWRRPVNLITPSITYLSPRYCDSSWALAVTSTMSDKIKIASTGKTIVQLSPQALINCGVGSCSKGIPSDAISFARKFGIPEESCQNYMGQNPNKTSCSDVQLCASCSGTLFSFSCTVAKNGKKWTLPDSGVVPAGAAAMKT